MELEKEHFHFRVSQIAALGLILAIIGTTIALIDFVGLSPYQTELDRKISKIETEGADIDLIRSVVGNELNKQHAVDQQARILRDLESVVKDEAALGKIKAEISEASALGLAASK